MSEMRSWQVARNGDPVDVLEFVGTRPVPEPGPRQILVKVEAAACNFVDILLCQGSYQEKPPLPFTPGVEVAGGGRRCSSTPPPAVSVRRRSSSPRVPAPPSS